MRRFAPALAVFAVAGSGLSAAPRPEPPKTARSAAAPAVPAAPAPTGGRVDLAYGAYQRGLYLTAYREATARLERDGRDAAAMTLVGELFNQGLGIKPNPKEAAAWYRLAAAQGDAHAMATLGLMSLDGRGVPRDPKAGREWLERAAALGEPSAAYNLALVLLAGGSEAEMAKAAKLLAVAAEAEIGDAQHALGVMRSRGQGDLAADPAEAVRLYYKAAGNGSLAGAVEYAIAKFNGDGTTRDEAEAARHFRLAAYRGNAIAQNRLARLHVTGRGVARNLVEAAAWNLAATEQGLADSWLDEAVRGLSAADRARAERLALERTGRS